MCHLIKYAMLWFLASAIQRNPKFVYKVKWFPYWQLKCLVFAFFSLSLGGAKQQISGLGLFMYLCQTYHFYLNPGQNGRGLSYWSMVWLYFANCGASTGSSCPCGQKSTPRHALSLLGLYAHWISGCFFLLCKEKSQTFCFCFCLVIGGVTPHSTLMAVIIIRHTHTEIG